MNDSDAILRRIERRALWLAGAGILAAGLAPGGGAGLAAAVGGGALLSVVSYWLIRRGATGLADTVQARGGASGAVRGITLMLLRYALLAGMAYVMIARLRLHPLGLLGGASVIPAAATLEFFRRRA